MTYNPLLIFIAAFIVNNILLMRYIGLCPFFGVSTSLTTAFGMSAAVLFVMLISTWITWLIYHFLLLPLDLVFLRTAAFILVIASLVQFVEMFLRKNYKVLYSAMGIYLPLITTNCAILAVTFLVINYHFSLFLGTIFALGTALGFGLVIILFSPIRDRLEFSPISRSLKGYPIAFIVASLVALAFLGFIGLFGLTL